MAYLALYREWRPQTFGEIVGQDHVTRTLKNAVEAGRIGHAYLFCGSRGTGKTTAAKVLAKALNCLDRSEPEPCNRCANCQAITEGFSVDVVEIDAASNRGIDEIRDLREKVKFAPATGPYRVYIIDEAHMLTNEAFNALLKTLEEPPAHVVFILATTEAQKMPLTILSRCQRFDFKRITPTDIIGRLKEVAAGVGISVDEEALLLIARAAEGGLRDALSILDQGAALGEMRVTVEDLHNILGTVRADLLSRMAGHLAAGDAAAALGLVGELTDSGKDLRLFAKELSAFLRALLLEKIAPGNSDGETWGDALKKVAEAAEFGAERLLRTVEILLKAEQEMKWGSLPGVILELALVKACRPELASDLTSLTARVAALEEKLTAVALGSRVVSVAPVTTPTKASPPKKKIKPESDKPTPPPVEPVLPDRPEAVRQQSVPAPAELEGVPPTIPDATPGGEEVASDDVELERVRKVWPRLMDTLRRDKPPLWPAFSSAAPLQVQGRTLTVGLPEEAELAMARVELPANKKFFEELLERFLEAAWQVRYQFYQGEPPLPLVPPSEPVDDISRRFKGQEVAEEEIGSLFDDE